MHQPQYFAHNHGIRIQLFRLLLRLACNRLGTIIEYVFFIGYPNTLCPVSP